METLKGSLEVSVSFLNEGQAAEMVSVRQLPLKEYDRAFELYDDEIGLTALICNKPLAWIHTITPESYELLHKTAKEVNAKGFFTFAERRMENMLKRMNSVRPEVFKVAAEKVSRNSLSGLLPRPD